MNGLWFAEQIIGSVIGALVFVCTSALVAWVWAKRKLLPFLRRHPRIKAMLEERELP